MSEQQEHSKGFKVTDRRSFTRDGERIAKPEEDQEVESGSSAAEVRAERPKREPEPPQREPSSHQLEARFLDLLSLLATQASLALGAPHPATGESHEDLETARVMIAMIEVLKAKTRGNLVPDEQAALDDILYQLRMEFMVKAKVIGT